MMTAVGWQSSETAKFEARCLGFHTCYRKRPKLFHLEANHQPRQLSASDVACNPSASATLRVISSGPHLGADSEGNLPSRHTGDWGLLSLIDLVESPWKSPRLSEMPMSSLRAVPGDNPPPPSDLRNGASRWLLLQGVAESFARRVTGDKWNADSHYRRGAGCSLEGWAIAHHDCVHIRIFSGVRIPSIPSSVPKIGLKRGSAEDACRCWNHDQTPRLPKRGARGMGKRGIAWFSHLGLASSSGERPT